MREPVLLSLANLLLLRANGSALARLARCGVRHMLAVEGVALRSGRHGGALSGEALIALA
jgi:hypothetical protein